MKDYILQEIERIKDNIKDPEAAHVIEDRLRENFIDSLAENKFTSLEEAMECAKLILTTNDLDFPRWCA